MTQTAPSRVGMAAAVVGLSGVAVNGLAYAVPLLGARILSPGDLGALAAALALGSIGSVAGLGLQTAVAVHRARHGTVRAGRVTVATAALVAGAMLVTAPLVAAALHLSFLVPLLIAATTAAVVLASRSLGELQGAQRFGPLAVAMGVLAVGRFGGVVAGLLAGAGVVGSLAVGVAASAATVPFIAWLATRSDPGPGPRPDADPGAGTVWTDERSDEGAERGGKAVPLGTGVSASEASAKSLGRAVASASSATLAMLTASYADLILARHYLSAADSGAYAVGAVLTKGALWAPAVVTVLALPRLAKGSARTLRVGTVAVAASGVALVAASALQGDLAIRLAGGSGYAGLASYAPLFAAVGALYALAFLFVNARIAAGARWPSAPLWVGTVALTVAVALLEPPTIGRVVACAAITATVATAVMAVLTIRRRVR
jgi:O-antigen/teichoic acid export membrane protein